MGHAGTQWRAGPTNSLALKLDGDTLTGKLTSPGRGGQTTETTINDAKLTGADVSFNVVRTYNDNTFTNKYTGTIADGAIKVKSSSCGTARPSRATGKPRFRNNRQKIKRH